MRRLLLLMIIFAPIFIWGQQFDSSNSTSRKALVLYTKGADGLYQATKDVYVDVVSNIEKLYTYNKGTNTLYAETFNGHYAIVLTKDMAKTILKDKRHKLIIYKPTDPNDESYLVNDKIKEMALKFDRKNNVLKDSIKTAKRIAFEDSIKRATKVKDSLATIQRAIDDKNYRINGKWFKVPYGKQIRCQLCDYYKHKEYIICPRIANDTIYWLDTEEGHLGLTYVQLHKCKIPLTIKNDKDFQRHCEIFKDSLSIADNRDFSNDSIEHDNALDFVSYVVKLTSIAPYGFILNWGWELNSADGIEPHFSYFNTSEKTIKYVDLYYSMYNDVGDKCYLKYDKSYIGKVRGVGPVEQFETGSWNWDRATHYTTPDATEMRIVKIVLTYMNGSTKTLTGNSIIFE